MRGPDRPERPATVLLLHRSDPEAIMPDSSDRITTGDVVALAVPSGAVGLHHAETNGRFEVVEVEGDRLHVTPENAGAPRYVLSRAHVTHDS